MGVFSESDLLVLRKAREGQLQYRNKEAKALEVKGPAPPWVITTCIKLTAIAKMNCCSAEAAVPLDSPVVSVK